MPHEVDYFYLKKLKHLCKLLKTICKEIEIA